MADDKPLSRWARAHGHKPAPPPYVPKAEPELRHDVNDDDADHELLPDRGPASLSDEDIALASVDPDDPRVQFARMVIDSMTEYQAKKARERS